MTNPYKVGDDIWFLPGMVYFDIINIKDIKIMCAKVVSVHDEFVETTSNYYCLDYTKYYPTKRDALEALSKRLKELLDE